MGGGHAVGHRHLHVPGSTPVHRLPAASKLVGLVFFAVVVALTPRRAVGAFAVDAMVIVGVVALARLPVRLVVTRLSVIAPFVVLSLIHI